MSFQTPKPDNPKQNTNEPLCKRSKQNHVPQNDFNYVEEIKRDFIKIFSDELNLHVFKYLPAADLSICARVSRQWWRLTNDRQLWKDLFLSRFKAPKRPNLTYRLESLQMIPSQINSIPKSQMLLDETCNNMADEEDWKNIYRVSHNWQTGNCRVIDFKPYVNSNKDQKQNVFSSSYSTIHEESRDITSPFSFFTRFPSNPPVNTNSNPLVQFTRHVILTASFSGINDFNNIPEVHLWRAGKQNEHIDTLRSEVLHKVITAQKSKFPITITCLKLDSNEGKDDAEIHKLVAGYSNGGFTIWEVDSLERSNSNDKSIRKWRHREIYTLPTISLHGEPCTQSALIACALHFPVLVTCTEDFELSIYFIDYKQDNNVLSSSLTEDEKLVEQVECRLVHQLRSFVCWAPLEISVECITKDSVQCTSMNYDSQDSWKAIVAYSVPLYGGGWTVGIQEIKFSATRLISTRHCSSLPSFIPLLSENNSINDIEQFSFAPITTITYNAGQLVTAHCDNTLQVYYVLEQGKKLECRHKCTLYGHTGSVMSIALDEHGKLITGSMDHSIKIWDLGWNLLKNNERRKSKDYDNDVTDVNHHHNLYQHTEFSKRKKHGECIVTLSDSLNNIREYEKNNLGIRWVGFDEGRIVSVCGGTTIKNNLQSNTNDNDSRKGPIGPPPGWAGSLSSAKTKVDSQLNYMEDIGIVKVWSFCDE